MSNGSEIPPVVLYLQGTLTILANLLLFLTVATSKKLQTSPNFLLLSNSVADLLVGVYVLPVFPARWESTIPCRPVPHEYCLMLTSVGAHLNSVSVAHWAAIALERLLRIFHVQFHKRACRLFLLPALLLCWTLPILPTYGRRFLPIVFQTYPYDAIQTTTLNDTCHALILPGCQCRFCVHRMYSLVALTAQYFVPLGVALICYLYIMIALHFRLRETERLRIQVVGVRESTNSLTTGLFQRTLQPVWLNVTRFLSSKDFRSFRLFLTILLVFFACISHYLVNRVRIVVGQPQKEGVREGYFVTSIMTAWSTDLNENLTEIAGYLNSLINPVLIFALSRGFRAGAVNLVRIVGATLSGSSTRHCCQASEVSRSRWNEWACRFYRERTK